MNSKKDQHRRITASEAVRILEQRADGIFSRFYPEVHNYVLELLHDSNQGKVDEFIRDCRACVVVLNGLVDQLELKPGPETKEAA